MITREQVADLRAGDVVEISEVDDGCLYVHRGPVQPDGPRKGALSFCGMWLRNEKGEPAEWIEALTVISRAPRPLYVNHDRTEPVPGDVVRDSDGDGKQTWSCQPIGSGISNPWWATHGPHHRFLSRRDLPDRLRLLVDGETGQVVL